MEGLRHSLLAPAGASIMIMFSVADAMKTSIAVRSEAKDDNGKPLFPHPYAPWSKVDPKHQDKADKAYRGYRMFENVKEWTFLSLPLMWIYSLYAGQLPYVSDALVDTSVVVSAAAYVAFNGMFVKGYVEAPEKRSQGFKLRMNVVKFWLFGSAAAVFYSSLERFGIIDMVKARS